MKTVMRIERFLEDTPFSTEFYGNTVENPTKYGYKVFVWKDEQPLLREIMAALSRGETYEGPFGFIESLSPGDRFQEWIDDHYSIYDRDDM